jgi:tRNA(fMet)-specific endonuclease VapC
MKVVLDTDILSELLRAKNATVVERARVHVDKHGPIGVSVLTVFEVLQGLHKANHPARAKTFLTWVKRCELLALDVETAQLAGEIGGALLRAGRPIGVVDVGLAATALRHDRVLVTGNTAHFEYVRDAGFGLEIENWRDV